MSANFGALLCSWGQLLSVRGLALLLVLCYHCSVSSSFVPNNKFGIGLVNAGTVEEIDKAQGIGGYGSWILLVFAGVDKTSTGPESGWVQSVQEAYAHNFSVVLRLSPPFGSEHYRDESDDPQHLNYTTLASAFAKVVSGFPQPPAGAGPTLWLQVENEPNLCTEWWCSKASTPISYVEMAKEYAHFHSYVYDAIKALARHWIKVCPAPLAPGGAISCGCCGHQSCSQDKGGTTGLQYMEAMRQAVPNIFTEKMDCLCSHSYPAAKVGSNFFVPFPQAKVGLTYYEQELKTINVGHQIPVLITETGWPTHWTGHPSCTEKQKAEWTVDAYGIWLNSSVVHGVMPFMLQDAYWGTKLGFEYVKMNGGVAPVYTAVKNKRCSLGFQPC